MTSTILKLTAIAIMASTLSGCIIYVEDKVDTKVTHSPAPAEDTSKKTSF
ncbi:hypothetical protein OVA03_02215 [Asticcacaulis sp. SL142]|nr:hypothetical protein [Asticcacaulis sp. SL142]WAC48769.1 hypothetical protein OVA03_02215 [Asticcacaulis sp. SL142]